MRWMVASISRLLVSVGLLVASACGGSTVSGSSIKSCHATSDCTSGESCLFSVYESCGAAGVCVASADGSACVQQTACSCSGVTETICLVNGNAPSPVSSLGSCDGATQQQGFDANVPDSTIAPPPADAGDSGPVTPEDSGPTPPDDADTEGDAADAAPTPVEGSLGWPCTSSTQCTDPAYNECHTVAGGGSKICTYGPCSSDGTCQPPAAGFCDTNSYCALH